MLGLIESMDYVPGKAQSILWQIATQNIEMPDYLKMDMEELVSISRNTFFSVLTAVRDIMGKRRRVMELTQIIDNNESLCDDLERKMIRKIFQNDQPTADKILLKELVLELGEITDLCEKISDRITIFNVKRQV
jgi:predicted phosphate transport protein (TIGR00153 family)